MTVQIGAPRDLGSAWGDWANYVDSPLRAFENELGVQALRSRYSTIRERGMQFGVRRPRVCVLMKCRHLWVTSTRSVSPRTRVSMKASG